MTHHKIRSRGVPPHMKGGPAFIYSKPRLKDHTFMKVRVYSHINSVRQNIKHKHLFLFLFLNNLFKPGRNKMKKTLVVLIIFLSEEINK